LAAQGITHPGGYRTAPSAGVLYPLDVYVVAGNVDSLRPGTYKYRPQGHELEKVAGGDVTMRRYWYLLLCMSERPGCMASGGCGMCRWR